MPGSAFSLLSRLVALATVITESEDAGMFCAKLTKNIVIVYC